MLELAIRHTPDSEVRSSLVRAASFGPDVTADEASAILGNGTEVSCQDTVPFCLWAAAKHLDSFEDAMWATLSALGDCDTTCAIVGAIVVLAAGAHRAHGQRCSGLDGIPPAWREKREGADL